MKTATVRQIRNQFPSVLRHIQNGESVAITSRRKVVATLVPPIRATKPRRPWQDLGERAKWLESQTMAKVSGAELLREDRDRY